MRRTNFSGKIPDSSETFGLVALHIPRVDGKPAPPVCTLNRGWSETCGARRCKKALAATRTVPSVSIDTAEAMLVLPLV